MDKMNHRVASLKKLLIHCSKSTCCTLFKINDQAVVDILSNKLVAPYCIRTYLLYNTFTLMKIFCKYVS